MAVATQTTKLPDVRVTPLDLVGSGPFERVGGVSAVVPHRPVEDDCDAVVWLVGRSGHFATLVIDQDDVWLRAVGRVGLIDIHYLPALAELAEAVSDRVREILRSKRETCHAS